MALKGIVIDPGHGGKDPGASGNGIVEKDFNLLISKYMYDRFKELGVPVKLIRSTDETVSPKERAKRAVDAYGNSKDVIVVSNHLNAGNGNGAEIIYALRNSSTLSKKILDNISDAGQNARKYYQLRLPDNSQKDYYFMHRDTPNTEAIIIEYGFVDNKDDAEDMKNNYKKYVDATIKGILEYKNIPYKESTESNDEYYIVKKGDTLWDISNKYGISVSRLKEINNLKSDLIQIGQRLKIEDSKVNSSKLVYKVVKGDNLYNIANKYGTTVKELKDINNLKSDTIRIGQELIIPTKYIKYTIKKGDSLWKIARDYDTTVSNLKSLNNIKSDLLTIGKEILVPSK